MPPYIPPKSGDLPSHGKAILNAAYTACRKEHPEDAGKELCAKIAWAAVKKDGYHQDSKGHWVQGMNERNITYLAPIQPLQAEGKRLAQVYVIDPTLNRAGWKANPAGIHRGEESLMKQPLLYEPGPNEQSDWVEADDPFWGGSHKGKWVRAGQPVSFDRHLDGSYHVVYDINSNHAWEDIVNRRAKAASPSCEIYDAHLTRPRGGGPAELELNDFEFSHVLLIPPGGEGAYPNAGVENFWETQAAWSGFTGAVASALNQSDEIMSTEKNENLLDPTEEQQLERVLDQLGLGELRDEDLAVDAAKWVQDVVEKPGRVRRYLESRGLIKKDEPIPLSLLQKLYDTIKDQSLKAAFLLAIRFKKGLTKKGVTGELTTVQPEVTTLNGELIAPEQPPIGRTTMSTNTVTNIAPPIPTTSPPIDYTKQLADKDAELKARDAKIAELQRAVQEAGLSLKAHEEGLGITHLQAKWNDAQSENERLSKALLETKARASLVDDMYRKVMVNKIVSARLEAGDIQPKEVDEYTARAMKLPAEALDERLQDAERSAKKMRELGLGRRETYGAGAALQPARKDLGYTVGDLSGVYGGRQ